MKKLENAKLSEILPRSLLREEQVAAMAAAFDAELLRLTEATRLVLHLPRLEELSGTILDLLAHQFHVDFYEPIFLSDEVKRALIGNSIDWHKKLGTRSAVETVNAAFNREIKIQEWYEYGGEPYWFRLRTAPFKNAPDLNAWLRQLQHVKNVRSWVEVILAREIHTTAYAGVARWKHGKVRRGMTTDFQTTRLGTTLVDGNRTLKISATQVVISYGDEQEVIDLAAIQGDLLKMRFTFPSGERLITLSNPREDLTPQEVQEVADFAIKNKIILNSAGDVAQNIRSASLVTTTVQVLF